MCNEENKLTFFSLQLGEVIVYFKNSIIFYFSLGIMHFIFSKRDKLQLHFQSKLFKTEHLSV